MINYYLTDTVFLEDPAVFLQKLALVGEARQEKIMKYRFDRDRRLSLAAALLLRRGLEEAGIPPGELRMLKVEEGSEGKPYLPDYPYLHFNLSHSGEMAMCVVADCPVGCDIQETTEIPEEMVQKFFHPEEYREMRALPKQKRQEFAMKLWVLKEAYVKAAGLGMTGLPFDQFQILLKNPAESQSEELYRQDQEQGDPNRDDQNRQDQKQSNQKQSDQKQSNQKQSNQKQSNQKQRDQNQMDQNRIEQKQTVIVIRDGQPDTNVQFPVIMETADRYSLAVCCRI